jgi:hypothetical protein
MYIIAKHALAWQELIKCLLEKDRTPWDGILHLQQLPFSVILLHFEQYKGCNIFEKFMSNQQ